MKMIKMSFILLAVMGLSFTSCKKDKTDKTDSTSLQQLAEDDANIQAAADESMNDVNGVLTGGNMKSTEFMPCNATVDSTSVSNDTITYHITYNGLNCNGNRLRQGQVQIKRKVNQHWIDAGAMVSVKFINLTITKVATGKSITMNGDRTYQNFSGGVIPQLGNGMVSSITHKIMGSLTVLFNDDNTTRTWNVAKQKVFTGTPGNLILTVDGLGTSGNYSNLLTWGVNRNGEEFYTQINTSVVNKQSCGWDPVSGVKIHQIPSLNKSVTVTFGYGLNNLPVTNGNCPSKFKVDWVNGTNSGTLYKFL